MANKKEWTPRAWVMNTDRTPANGPSPAAPVNDAKVDLDKAMESAKNELNAASLEKSDLDDKKRRDDKLYDDKRRDRYAKFDHINQRGSIHDGNGREVWSGERGNRKSMRGHLSGLSFDSLSRGVAEEEMCTWMNSFFLDMLENDIIEELPEPSQKALLRADMPFGQLEPEDQERMGEAMAKLGLVYEDGYLTIKGIQAAETLQNLSSKLDVGMPMEEHTARPAPKTTAEATKLWGETILKGTVENKEAWSNGHVIFMANEKTQPPSSPKEVHPKTGKPIDMEKLWSDETGKVITPIGVSGTLRIDYNRKGAPLEHNRHVWFDSEQTMDVRYFDAVKRAYPNAVFRQASDGDHQKPIEVFDGLHGERVGLVMGSRASEYGVPPKIRELLYEDKQELRAEQPQIPWHIARDKEGIKLVSPGGERKPVNDFQELESALEMVGADDPTMADLRDDLQRDYWQMMTFEEYQAVADAVSDDMYGISSQEVVRKSTAELEWQAGNNPAVMLQEGGMKLGLEVKGDIINPYNIGHSPLQQPSTPSTGFAASTVAPGQYPATIAKPTPAPRPSFDASSVPQMGSPY